MCVTNPPGSGFFLAQHTFAVRVEGAIIILDSRTDDYILVEAHLAPGFSALFSKAQHRLGDEDEELAGLVQELKRRGSITTNGQEGKFFEAPERPVTSLEIPGPDIVEVKSVRLGHIFHMISSLLTAGYFLRFRGLSSAISHVANLRSRRASATVFADPSDLVEAYNRMRPFFYDSKDKCLFNSLSMIIFLSKYGIVPRWHFGVKLSPFEAHCWVEDERWLYNDQYARTWRYVPIMQA